MVGMSYLALNLTGFMVMSVNCISTNYLILVNHGPVKTCQVLHRFRDKESKHGILITPAKGCNNRDRHMQ